MLEKFRANVLNLVCTRGGSLNSKKLYTNFFTEGLETN